MDSSATATNMGNAGGKRRKRHLPGSESRLRNISKSVFDGAKSYGFCPKRHLCDLRRENDFQNDGVESGQALSSILAILVSDLVPNLSAEDAVQLVTDVTRSTDCSKLC